MARTSADGAGRSEGRMSVVYIHDPTVDIAELFEAEKTGAMGAVIKHVALD